MGASSTVTVLFCDLVGSTALLSSLSAEAGDDVRRACFDALRRAVAAHDGVEVKNLGDGLMVVFSSAAQAVACGIRMQREMDGLARRGGPAARAALRVGVSAGEATEEDGDWFGTPVVEAARLCAVAEAGQVLVADIVRLLCGSHGGHVFSAPAPYELKGLPAPVQACTVTGGAQDEAVLPPALTASATAPFVGRTAERERLGTLWKRASDDERAGLVLLSGEPGAGKTRLAAELAAEAAGGAGRVLFGRCDEELGVPYQPFVEALEAFWQATPDVRLLGRHPDELCRLLPQLSADGGLQAPPRADPETEQYRLFQAVASWLTVASAAQPLLVVLDDLHWAGTATLLLLRHVVRNTPRARLLLVGTYRDTDLEGAHPLSRVLADLRREESVERLSVRGLDAGEVAAFAEASTGHRLDGAAQALADRVHAETAGNPFFVGEVLRHLTETGVLWLDGGALTAERSVGEAGIPDGVREVVGRRVARLGPGAEEVLRAAAVIGQRFDFAVLQRVAGDDAGAERVLEEAVRAQLVEEAAGPRPAYAFTHALLRATLYEELSALRRARLHRDVAAALEAEFPGRLEERAAELAHHWRLAGSSGDLGRALDWSRRAAEQAMEALAWQQAVLWYERWIELADEARAGDEPERARMLLRLGEARRGAGDPAYRATLLDAAARAYACGDLDTAAHALLGTPRNLIPMAGRVDQEVVDLVEAVLAATAPEEVELRARLLGLLARELSYAAGGERRLALADEAIALARSVGDPLLLEEALRLYIGCVPGPATLPRRVEIEAELASLAGALRDPRARIMSATARWNVLMEDCRVDEARQVLASAAAVAEEFGEPSLRWHVAHLQTAEVAFLGHLGDAVALLHRAAELGRLTEQPDLDEWLEGQGVSLAIDVSGVDDLLPDMRAPGPSVQHLSLREAGVALAHAMAGDDDRARSAVTRIFEEGIWDDASFLYTHRVVATLLARLGDTERVPELIAALTPFADRLAFHPLTIAGTVAETLGRLERLRGDLDAAAGHFAWAIRRCEELGSRRWAAHARRHLASVLVERDGAAGRTEARDLLARALADAEALGMDRFAARARRALEQVEAPGA